MALVAPVRPSTASRPTSARPRAEWNTAFNGDSGTRGGVLPRYEGLRDPSLQAYFSKRGNRQHLMTAGLVSHTGVIVGDPDAKLKLVADAMATAAAEHKQREAQVSGALTARLVHTRKLEEEAKRHSAWSKEYARAKWRRQRFQQKVAALPEFVKGPTARHLVAAVAPPAAAAAPSHRVAAVPAAESSPQLAPALRPQSARTAPQPRPPSAGTRPTSAVTRPTSAVTRPTSARAAPAGSRPGSARRPVQQEV